eukprot:m.1153084 g.1153084  ORF g.1153084 m.1153084 type:complete len:291 (+) comp24486_c0_seq18:1650-2522(+)
MASTRTLSWRRMCHSLSEPLGSQGAREHIRHSSPSWLTCIEQFHRWRGCRHRMTVLTGTFSHDSACFRTHCFYSHDGSDDIGGGTLLIRFRTYSRDVALICMSSHNVKERIMLWDDSTLLPCGYRTVSVDKSILLTNPSANVSDGSFSQYSRCPGDRNWPDKYPGKHPAWFMNNCEKVPAPNITSMGYTVRTHSWRYTLWLEWDGASCSPKWASTTNYGRELYAHDDSSTFPIDFDCCENDNLIDDPRYTHVVAQLDAMLRKRYQHVGDGVGCPNTPPDAAPALEDDSHQ